ncbi:MAG TPA: nucleotidyltransferase [Rhodocyclaceae bacterium]|uniref:nucleotidyltransferase domain-containing protein n=1 Tax=Accumulibacter sp. TaxID=2053492 RepID=UPI002B830936|nr:nucleotidyltransferase [Accumulibacter sp.]HNB79893.1 nucleotidyltransferase [Rhodocyclaceae bacterium]HNC21967.1 nucleotidyltransferase [Accumulibacter sp.]HNH14719.1 nucleotidyltransferase [Rhodocyclaceae bacterium]HNI00469.1 nucleotidyltransferase [Rhodocyclaceae bacterium]
MNRDENAVVAEAYKKRTLVAVLDQLCQQLDLTDTQYETARERYGAIGEWLAGGASPHLQNASIYAHGSIGLGTANKPIGRNEFDVDLMCHLPATGPGSSPAAVKALVGARLREHGKYREMLEEKPRCWRINYANEFHLDISPSIPNPQCDAGGELVPDKNLATWKPTNPEGYMNRFEAYADLCPVFYLREVLAKATRADVEPFPEQEMSKPLLKRIVQLLKRNRDHEFLAPERQDLAPISIIITTLAAWSYAECVAKRHYADAFELIIDVIARMPEFIRVEDMAGRKIYMVENETTIGENFAEKWNRDEGLATTFFSWHKNALKAFNLLLGMEGLDAIGTHLSKSFGVPLEYARRSLEPHTNAISVARAAGALQVVPSLGVVTSIPRPGVGVRPNTFFGR